MGGIQSLRTTLLQEPRTTLYFCEIIYLDRHAIQGNPSPKEQLLWPSVTKMLPSIFYPETSLQIVSLNKYTMWQKFKDQKEVFKNKLKLVHTQVEKTKAGASFT